MRTLICRCLLAVVLLSACSTATAIRDAALVSVTSVAATVSPQDVRLETIAILPVVSARMKAVYQAGLAQGNNPHVFSKLGDCMTENPYFLAPLSDGKYDLGEYQGLKSVIAQFAGYPARSVDGTTPESSPTQQKDSFATVGLASAGGFNIAAPLDATWADPKWCQSGESPLACEYRVAKPSIAIIMFGTNDVNYTDATTYDLYLRMIISATLSRNIVPILNTFPTRPEDPQKSQQLNLIVAQVAHDFDIPLVNLNRALDGLPNKGVNPGDTAHLSVPQDNRVDLFTSGHLTSGFTLRNLVTLQALEKVLEVVR